MIDPKDLQRFLAYASVTTAATRGNEKGVKSQLFERIAKIDLNEFCNSKLLHATLDNTTMVLAESGALKVPWGTARKCLNIFLREALYNFYARQQWELISIESILELPLDHRVASGLYHDDGGAHRLGKLKTIKGLCPAEHARYQIAAEVIARKQGTERVHLDIRYWPASGDA
jgi:hypothetical protein